MNEAVLPPPLIPQLPRSKERLLFGGFIALIAAGIASLSLGSTLWLILPGLTLLAILALRLLRPTPLELLFFLAPLIYPTAAAFFQIKGIYFMLIWVFGLLVLWYLQQSLAGWKGGCVPTPYVIFFIAYDLLLLVSIFTHPAHKATATTLSLALALIGFYWLLSQTIHMADLRRLLISLFAGAVAGSLFFLWAYSRENSLLLSNALAVLVIRPTVMEYTANEWSLYPMLGFPIAFALLVFKGIRGRDYLWLFPGLVILLLVVLTTMSRSTLLGLFASSVLILLVHPRGRKVVGLGLAGTLIYFTLLQPQHWTMLSQLLRLESGLSGRGAIWPMAWDLITQHPFNGLGPGWLTERYFMIAPFMESGLFKSTFKLSAHNAYLQIGVDLGLIAILVALAIMVIFTLRSIRLWKSLRQTPNFLILLTVGALALTGFIRSLFESDFLFPHGYLNDNLLLVILLAFQDTLYARAHASYEA